MGSHYILVHHWWEIQCYRCYGKQKLLKKLKVELRNDQLTPLVHLYLKELGAGCQSSMCTLTFQKHYAQQLRHRILMLWNTAQPEKGMKLCNMLQHGQT